MKTADGVDPVAPLAPFLEPASPFPGVGQTLSPLLFQEQENDQATHPSASGRFPKCRCRGILRQLFLNR